MRLIVCVVAVLTIILSASSIYIFYIAEWPAVLDTEAQIGAAMPNRYPMLVFLVGKELLAISTSVGAIYYAMQRSH